MRRNRWGAYRRRGGPCALAPHALWRRQSGRALQLPRGRHARYSGRRRPSEFIHGARIDGLEALRIASRPPARLPARIAAEVVAAVFGNIGVVVPEMLLPFHAFDGGALLVPNRRDIEEHIRLPAHLLGLVRFEKIELRRAENLLTGIVAPCLRDHATLDGEARREAVVGVVGVVLRMAHHERGLDLADQVDELEFVVARHFERVIAEIKKHDIMRIERFRGILRLDPPRFLDGLKGGAAFLLPEFRALAALAEGQAGDRHVIALLLMQGDCPAASPDEVGSMGANDKGGFFIRHCSAPQLAAVRSGPVDSASYLVPGPVILLFQIDIHDIIFSYKGEINRKSDRAIMISMAPNLRHLRAVCVVSEQQSFSRASAKVFPA